MVTFTTCSILAPCLLLLFFLISFVLPLNQNHILLPTNENYTNPPKIPYFSIHETNETNAAPKFEVITSSRRTKNTLEIIEEGLARARAAIRQAIRSRNFTSNINETFIPRGVVYRNPYAFHQSHIEMVKRFKVWAYEEGERPVVHEGPLNDIYAIEGQFISIMEDTKSPFRAQNPEEAHLFFLPISVASIIHYIYMPITKHTDYSRDRLQRVFTDYVNIVANKYSYWNRSLGADHFMLSCHDWGPDVSLANPTLFKNFIKVLCNANSSEEFEPKRDVPLPEIYLTYGGLGSDYVGQAPRNRPILAFFEGRAHGYVREILFKHWKDRDKEIIVAEKLPVDGKKYRKMGRTKFCLCPSGFEVASPRVVEAIYQGCVPVIISDNYSLPFNDVLNWDKFSVQIPVRRIPEIKMILRGISHERYFKMYRRVKMVKRHFELNKPTKPFDVTHMILHSLWLKRLNVRLA